ncbi:MAG: hypothetical protein RLZZ251_590 [Actinomycetota bacterium]|jgi:sugar/nucleoside kinase (ribokinase family)
MTRIVCIGDAMVDVIVELGEAINIGSDTKSKISLVGGGAAANTACWLGHTGQDVIFVGKVGNDAAGQQFVSDLEAHHVHHGDLRCQSATTGIVVVLVDDKGERTMFPDPGANSLLSRSDLPELDNTSGAFLSGYSLYNPALTEEVRAMMQLIKSAGIPLIFDPASVGPMRNFGREKVISVLKDVDCVILNRDEARFLSGSEDIEEAIRILHHSTETVVIKVGSDGAICIDKENGISRLPSVATSVVDTTGAGDAFAAGFLPIWLERNDLHAAVEAGNRLAGECVAILGARPRVNPR